MIQSANNTGHKIYISIEIDNYFFCLRLLAEYIKEFNSQLLYFLM